MATKDEAENEIVKEHLENQDLNGVCKTAQFPDNNIHLHPTRKRCVSTSNVISPSPKKKKKDCQNIIPPKKFLLGGTISDPLNLNSLQNEDINKAMNKTPKSSPLHANTVNIKKDQVNVIIPKNLADPLELSTCVDAKAIACSDLDLLRKKTIEKSSKPLLKSLSDSGPLIEITQENKNISECIDKKKQNKDTISSSNKKLKTGSPENNHVCKPENNNILCAVDVQKKIKEISHNKVPVQSINSCNNPIQKTPAEVLVKSCETPSLSLEIGVDEAGKKTQVQCELKSERCIVIPVVPQTALSEKSCKSQKSNITSTKPKKNNNEPKFKEKNALFKYGNYNRYYGYRNPEDEDNRLKVLAERMDLFYGKDVLDIGCNIGHVTFSVARDFGAKSIVGMDIDRKLINIARKNVQYYINDAARFSREPNYHFNDECASNSRNDPNCDITQSFPISLPILYGPLNVPGMSSSGRFPHNVSFVQGNYVLESDTMLTMDTCKFDVILCLSITKWLHLNWGDDGLKRAFKRMFLQLRPGGILVVEPQPWKSYGRRKALTETIWRNYKNIQLKPPMFTEYLLNEVGFANCETLTMPHNPSKGFQRPLKLYFKPNTKNVPTSTIVQPN